MRKNYRVSITNGSKKDSFIVLGNSKGEVNELCDIVHVGTGWSVSDVGLAMKRRKCCEVKEVMLF